MKKPRTNVLPIRLSDVEYEQMKAAAARFGLTPSEWLRAVGMRSLLVDPRDPEEQAR